MKSFSRIVGSPTSIVAFEAAGRHLSFSKAANELNVSQPAVSRQIRNLELHVGEALFVRKGNKVWLSRKGAILFNEVTSSFQRIVTTLEQVQDLPRQNSIVIRSQPIVISTFVLPIFIELQRAFPALSIDLRAVEDSAPIESDRISFSILYGNGGWPGMASEKLFEEVLFPVCRPSLVDGRGSADPDEIFNELPLLQVSAYVDEWMNWHSWASHFGVRCLSSKRPQLINDYEKLLQACKAGQGVALGSLYLVAPYLEERSLVRVTSLSVRSKFGMYLVYSHEALLNQEFKALYRWIKEKANDFHRGCQTFLD